MLLNLTCIIFLVDWLVVVLNRKNILITIMFSELLLTISLNFVVFSIYLDDIVSQIFVLFILTIAADESAIGLAIVTVLYKLKNYIKLKPIKKRNNKL